MTLADEDDAADDIRQTFFSECADGLRDLDAGLAALKDGTAEPETLQVMFRAVHSIKGGAGSFDLEHLRGFAYTFERVLDLVRNGTLVPDAGCLKLLTRSAELLRLLVAAGQANKRFDMRRCKVTRDKLQALLPPPEPDNSPAIEFAPVAFDLSLFDDIDQGIVRTQRFRIRFKPQPALYAKGNETTILFREVGKLGSIDVTCDASALPPLERIEPENAYFTWSVELETAMGEDAVREIFDFVEWDSDLSIEAVQPA